MSSIPRIVVLCILSVALVSCTSGEAETPGDESQASSTTSEEDTPEEDTPEEDTPEEDTSEEETAESAGPRSIFEGSSSRLQVAVGTTRDVTVELFAFEVSGTWSVVPELSSGATLLDDRITEGFEIDGVFSILTELTVGVGNDPALVGTEQTVELNVVPEDPSNPSTSITITIDVVGPGDPVGPGITDDFLIARGDPDSLSMNVGSNDSFGTDGFDLENITIQPMEGLEIGVQGGLEWVPSGIDQTTTYELCDRAGVCNSGEIRFLVG